MRRESIRPKLVSKGRTSGSRSRWISTDSIATGAGAVSVRTGALCASTSLPARPDLRYGIFGLRLDDRWPRQGGAADLDGDGIATGRDAPPALTFGERHGGAVAAA